MPTRPGSGVSLQIAPCFSKCASKRMQLTKVSNKAGRVGPPVHRQVLGWREWHGSLLAGLTGPVSVLVHDATHQATTGGIMILAGTPELRLRGEGAPVYISVEPYCTIFCCCSRSVKT